MRLGQIDDNWQVDANSCVLTLKKTSWTDTLHRGIPSRGSARNVRGALEQCRAPKSSSWTRQDGVCAVALVRTGTRQSGRATAARLEHHSSTPRECAMPCQDRKVLVCPWQAFQAPSLRATLTRIRKGLCWLHSDVNVSDGLSQFDHHAVSLIQDFLQRQVRKKVFNPTFTSATGLRAQGRGKKQVSKSSTNVDT